MQNAKKIKVLHIITRLDAGGSATNTIETVARQDSDTYESSLISGLTYDPDGHIENSLKARNITYCFINELRRDIHPWYDAVAFFKLFKKIKEGEYGIVHTHTSKAGILGRWAAKAASVKFIVHTPHGHVFYGYFGKFLTRIFLWSERLTARITHKIITLTQKGKMENIFFKIAEPDKFVPIYSGIDIQMYEKKRGNIKELKKQFQIPLDAVVFGAIARLDPIKGNVYLIEAMAEVVKELPNSRLILIGDGSERLEIEKRIETLNLFEHVILTGYREDSAQLLELFDIFVLASLNEGMGRVILEAMASGKPVIATRTGGIPELVVEGRTGILVPPAQSDQFALAMLDLAKNPKMAKELGKNGKNIVKDVFGVDKMVKEIERLYEGLGNSTK